MADTGWEFVGAGNGFRDVGGDQNWSSASNVTADDGSNTNVDLFNTNVSQGIYGDTVDFSVIPAGATIDGVEVRVGDYTGESSETPWTHCVLVLGDNTDGTENKESELLDGTGSLQTDEAGGASDLWGETITEADDTSDADFGFYVAVENSNGSAFREAKIDFMQMKVYYSTGPSCVLSGTADGATEAQIVSGGRTIILTLFNDTWVAAGATFEAQRQNIIDGLDSAQSETLGWNNEIRDTLAVAQVVRTSSTVVTITIDSTASADYKIVADEVITVTVPASALVTSGSPVVPVNLINITAECDETLPPTSIDVQTNLAGDVTDIDESVDAPDANWLELDV